MLLKDSNNCICYCCNTEGSEKNENENVGDMFMNRFQNLLIPLLALAVFFSTFSFGSGEQQQASIFKLSFVIFLDMELQMWFCSYSFH